jgi:hypothetical protein
VITAVLLLLPFPPAILKPHSLIDCGLSITHVLCRHQPFEYDYCGRSARTMAPPKAPQGPFTVDYQSEDELKDSEYQVRWSKIMDQGKYKNASTYEKVEVLLLRWADNCNDLDLTEEVEELERVFEKDFNYGARVAYLDSSIEQKLQVQINGKVASFVSDHDGQNTLLIVYYAGHGRPGRYYGSLEFTG